MHRPDRTSDCITGMSEWPHQKIHAEALRYIRRHAMNQQNWRVTQLASLQDALVRIVHLEAGELSIVSCFIDAQRWYAMTTTRVFGIYRGSRFEFSPLQIRKWTWGDFKRDGRLEIEVAEVLLTSGEKITLAYEAGFAAMAPIYYERFWHTRYRALGKLAGNVERPEK